MKHFKLFFAICLMSVCIGANAQSEAGKMPFDPRYHFLLETKVGAYHHSRGGFGTNFVLEKEVQKYLAWDIFRPEDGCPRFLSPILGRADSRIQQPGFGLRLWHHHHSYRSWNCQSRTWIRFFVGPWRTVSGASFRRLRLGIQYCQNRQRQVRNRTLRKARMEVLNCDLKHGTL